MEELKKQKGMKCQIIRNGKRVTRIDDTTHTDITPICMHRTKESKCDVCTDVVYCGGQVTDCKKYATASRCPNFWGEDY